MPLKHLSVNFLSNAMVFDTETIGLDYSNVSLQDIAKIQHVADIHDALESVSVSQFSLSRIKNRVRIIPLSAPPKIDCDFDYIIFDSLAGINFNPKPPPPPSDDPQFKTEYMKTFNRAVLAM